VKQSRLNAMLPCLVLSVLFPAPDAAADIQIGAPTFEVIEPSRSSAVINEKSLRNERPANLAEMLRTVPGVEVVQQGGLGQTTTVFLRGARSEDTLVLIDGAELNDATSPGGGYDFSLLTPNNVSRIEVYRGPQAVRYGAGALGGVINIITKDGRGPLAIGYTAAAGTYGTHRAALSLRGGSQAFGLSGGLDHFSTNGFSSASGGKEPDAARLRSLALKASWEPASGATVIGTLRIGSGAVATDRGGGPANDDPNYETKARELSAGVIAQSWLAQGRVRTSLGLFHSANQRDYRNDPDAEDASEANGYFRGQNQRLNSETEIFLGERHQLRLNLQARREEARATALFNGLSSAIDRRTQGTFGEGLTYLYEAPAWFGDLGLRHDQGSAFGSTFSMRASAGRRFINERAKLFATFGTGFKPASLYQRFSVYGNENLAAERAQALELSFEKQFVTKSTLTITAFTNRFQDLIDYNAAAERFFNVSEARTRGAEALVQADLTNYLRGEASYAYLRARDAVSGEALVRRPLHSGSASLHWQEGKATGFLRYRYRGARADVNSVSFTRLRNPGYGLVDMGTGYEVRPWLTANLRLENAFAKAYEEIAGYGTPGRAFTLRLSGEF